MEKNKGDHRYDDDRGDDRATPFAKVSGAREVSALITISKFSYFSLQERFHVEKALIRR